MSLHFAFVDLQKAFERVFRDFTLWARKLVMEEWLVTLVQAI